ncbi:hemerythrin domain-containing protein [Erythrobacter sp. NFXS35]|uniref:hemerythrin domain-containing protein n=1 Tax=Erythrobacter sp. NFXS35 TaxID=2818436 RepID=UPI0032E01E40
MSLLDRLAATLTPAASDEERRETRLGFEKIAEGQLFAEDILRQHKQIEQLFAQARSASGPAAQAAVTELSLLLNAHAMAEEAVIYPEVSENSGKTHAGMAYEEHVMTKVQLAKLQKLEPGSEEWIEKLDHIESAVQQHIHQEEGSWLPDVIRNAPLEIRQRMSVEYRNYFDRFDRG